MKEIISKIQKILSGWFNNKKIYVKIALVVSLVTIVSLSFVTISVSLNLYNKNLAQRNLRLKFISHYLKKLSVDYLLSNQGNKLNSVYDFYVKNDREILYIVLNEFESSDQMKYYVSDQEIAKAIGTEKIDEQLKVFADHKIVGMVYNEGQTRKINISSQSHEILQRILIEDVIVGYLRIGVSDEYFWSEMKANMVQIIGISMAGLIILILIIFSSIRKMILKPLTGVVSMLHGVSDIEEIPEEEIGYLESTFARITASIKEATLKLERSLEDSEKKKNEIALSKEELEETNLKLQNTMNELVAAYEEMEASNEELEAQSQEIIYMNQLMERDAALLKSIFLVAPTGIGILKDNCFGWTNQMVQKLTGLSDTELNGRNIRILFQTEDEFQLFVEEQNRQIAKSGICSMEMTWVSNSNSTRQILFASTPLAAANSEEGLTFTALDISAQKQLERNLQVSLEEKEILLREIHHRVKNNMQIISSMMNLQSDYVRDPAIRELFKDSQRRVRSMAIVHEKLYQSKNFSEINFSEFINNLVNEINNFFQPSPAQISFSIEVQNLYLSIDKAVPCALIINELVSNSLKYAFVGLKQGTIVINFWKSGELTYELTISDNGIGFAEGFDLEKSESFGLRLVTILVEQLRGEMEIHREKGVAFEIKFS